MFKFIEEFYYGNIDPQARNTKENKAVQKQMEVLISAELHKQYILKAKNKKKSLRIVF